MWRCIVTLVRDCCSWDCERISILYKILGLGRTGVLIACYLVYSLRVSANDAIRYVRYRRPGSVQTRGQIVCVRHFAQFILPQITTFFIK